MKQVQYRDTVTFALPDDWIEDLSHEEAGLYFEDREDAGLLQVSLTTATNPNPITPDMIEAMLDSLTTNKTKQIETLDNGSVLLSYVTPSREEGTLRVIFFWILGRARDAHRVQIVNFNYTLLAANAAGIAATRTVGLLDKSVRQAEFGQ